MNICNNTLNTKRSHNGSFIYIGLDNRCSILYNGKKRNKYNDDNEIWERLEWWIWQV